MSRVVVVGAGLYGLITAKTYLELTGTYDAESKAPSVAPNSERDNETDISEDFKSPQNGDCRLSTNLLIFDSASNLGGTWAKERLYPNLYTQNSFGLYEFSDEALRQEDSSIEYPATPNNGNFIPGWRVCDYLTRWCEKWDLLRRLRLNSKVYSIKRCPNKIWELVIEVQPSVGSPDTTSNLENSRRYTIYCDKLILAPGLTSEPNKLEFSGETEFKASGSQILHSKDVGPWCVDRFGYEPDPVRYVHTNRAVQEPKNPTINDQKQAVKDQGSVIPRNVAIYGGAKSAFDLVHLFATLHERFPDAFSALDRDQKIHVHWIIRKSGSGPAWMAPAQSRLPNGKTVYSDMVASTRFIGVTSPCVFNIPKRITSTNKGLRLEGTWSSRILHGNPIGRHFIAKFWRSLDVSWSQHAGYMPSSKTNQKLAKLRPVNSVLYCGSPLGITNQVGFWDIVKSFQVDIHRSSIKNLHQVKTDLPGLITLENGTIIENVNLIVTATGWKMDFPIKFEPLELHLSLGISLLIPDSVKAEPKEHDAEEIIKFREHLKHWSAREAAATTRIHHIMKASSKPPPDTIIPPAWEDAPAMVPFRLFRRIVSPALTAENDRSFAVVGMVLTATTAIVAEIQALWAVAYLVNGLGNHNDPHCESRLEKPRPKGSLDLGKMSLDDMEKSVAEDVVWGNLTSFGLAVDTMNYNDILLRDLGLNPFRKGGSYWTELTEVYRPSDYKGIVQEWLKLKTGQN